MPLGTHFINKCSCGAVLAQCRCPGEKTTTVVPNGCAACATHHAALIQRKSRKIMTISSKELLDAIEYTIPHTFPKDAVIQGAKVAIDGGIEFQVESSTFEPTPEGQKFPFWDWRTPLPRPKSAGKKATLRQEEDEDGNDANFMGEDNIG